MNSRTEHAPVNRICVIGPPGSGKSTVARALGEILDLPVVHLDTHFWKPGWVASDDDDFDARVREHMSNQEWVIDGNYNRTLPERLGRADLIVFLDLPRNLYLFRILKRRVMFAGRPRPDMTEGCIERIDRVFWDWSRQWHRGSRNRKLDLLAEHAKAGTVVSLRSRAEVRWFLGGLRARTLRR